MEQKHHKFLILQSLLQTSGCSAAQNAGMKGVTLPVNTMMVSACGRPDIPAIALSPVHGKMEGEMWSGKCLKHAVVMG